jgi:hypothetical protein
MIYCNKITEDGMSKKKLAGIIAACVIAAVVVIVITRGTKPRLHSDLHSDYK